MPDAIVPWHPYQRTLDQPRPYGLKQIVQHEKNHVP